MKEFFRAIPQTKYANQTLDVFSTDDRIRPYPHHISYKFNSHGYRSNEFERQSLNVLTIGCSVAFGNGIPVETRFSDVFCSLLGAANWNMAWPGESVDYVGRMLAVVLPVMKPEVLVVSFPSFCRREFFDAFGKRYDFRPDRKCQKAVETKIHGCLLGLTSDYQDLANFFTVYTMINYLCKSLSINWLYSIRKHDDVLFDTLEFDKKNKVPGINRVDVARDGGHPGIVTNANFGKSLFEKHQELYV